MLSSNSNGDSKFPTSIVIPSLPILNRGPSRPTSPAATSLSTPGSSPSAPSRLSPSASSHLGLEPIQDLVLPTTSTPIDYEAFRPTLVERGKYLARSVQFARPLPPHADGPLDDAFYRKLTEAELDEISQEKIAEAKAEREAAADRQKTVVDLAWMDLVSEIHVAYRDDELANFEWLAGEVNADKAASGVRRVAAEAKEKEEAAEAERVATETREKYRNTLIYDPFMGYVGSSTDEAARAQGAQCDEAITAKPDHGPDAKKREQEEFQDLVDRVWEDFDGDDNGFCYICAMEGCKGGRCASYSGPTEDELLGDHFGSKST